MTGEEEGLPISRDVASCLAVIDGCVVHVPDLFAESDAEFANTKDHARRVGFRTLLVAPLLREGTGIGAIAIRRVDPRHFGEKQIGLLQI